MFLSIDAGNSNVVFCLTDEAEKYWQHEVRFNTHEKLSLTTLDQPGDAPFRAGSGNGPLRSSGYSIRIYGSGKRDDECHPCVVWRGIKNCRHWRTFHGIHHS